MMASKWLKMSFVFHLIFRTIKSDESLVHCWRCEVTIQSADVFRDDCDAHFDFTQHTREDCTGKCWKSVDLIDRQQYENKTDDRPIIKYRSRSKLKSSRRCFSANELIQAAELGINTSDGCRQVERDDQKVKEICFCSDQDLCNNACKSSNYVFLLFSSLFVLYFKKLSASSGCDENFK
ncbi:unnamed protein product [Rotaria magnacalcarata]|uniref:Protein sleepless n=1 Tax=Rotaria magnacalcarata TaxID=392030 RepID=A0A819QMN0_9BILA|nr:unnamed protein product [Rotaria magnacalcarata]CAF4033487.1 unnamed protein product [Rotaria magnacalcarata]